MSCDFLPPHLEANPAPKEVRMMRWIAWLMIVDYQVRPGNHKLHSFTGGEASKPEPINQTAILDQSSQVPAINGPTTSIGVSDRISEPCCILQAKFTRSISGADTLDFYSAVRSTLTFQIAAPRDYAPLANKLQFGSCSTISTKALFSNAALAIVQSLTQPLRRTAA
jgi:hypothetical protein